MAINQHILLHDNLYDDSAINQHILLFDYVWQLMMVMLVMPRYVCFWVIILTVSLNVECVRRLEELMCAATQISQGDLYERYWEQSTVRVNIYLLYLKGFHNLAFSRFLKPCTCMKRCLVTFWSQIASRRKGIYHISCYYSCVFKCLLKWPDQEVALSHWLHLF